jgi:hypothetical protein
MSNLLIRPFVEADWKWMDLQALRLSPENVKEVGMFTYICLEANKPVGFALGRRDMGRSPKATESTCVLFLIRSLIAGRWDIFLALMERHAQNGIDTGHTHAQARVPLTGQCTNVAGTTALTGELATRFGLRWRDVGRDVGGQVSEKQMEFAPLVPLRAALKTRLDALGCVRTWR